MMPSSVLLFSLLVMYIVISGRLTWSLDNFKSLMKAAGFMQSKKIAPKKKSDDDGGTGDLPPGEGKQA